MAKGEKILHEDIIEKGDPFALFHKSIVQAIDEIEKFKKVSGGNLKNGKDLKDYAKATDDATRAVKELQRIEEATLTARTKMAIASEKSAQVLEIEKQKLSAVNRENKLNAEIANAAAGSYNKLSAEYRKNLDQLKQMQVTNKAELKARQELSKVVNQQNNELKKLDKTLGNHQRNVGNYTSALGDAAGQFGVLGVVMNQAQAGLNLVKVAFGSLKTALISTGIGALVVAIGSLVAWFKNTIEGAEQLKRVLAPIKGIFTAISETAEKLGKGLASIFSGDFKKGWQELKSAISEVNMEMGKQIDLAKQIAEQDIKITQFNRAAKLELARLDKEISEQRRIAMDEENYNTSQQLEAIKRAMELTKTYNAIKIQAANQELEKNRLLLQSDTDNVDAFIDSQILLENVKKEASDNERELLRRTNTLIKRAAEENIQVERVAGISKMEIKGATEVSITNTTITEIQKRKEAEAAYNEWLISEEQRKQQLIQEAKQATLEFTSYVGNAIFSMNAESINQEMQDAAKLRDYKIQLAGDSAKGKAAAENEYQKKVKELKRKEAKAERDQKIFNTTINMLEAIVKATTAGAGPIGIIFGALMAAFDAAILAKLISTPLPSFRKGTKYLQADGTGSDKDGLLIQAHHGERIVPAKENKLIGDIENNQLPGLVYLGKKYNSEFPILAEIANRQVQEQEKTNGLLKKFKFVDKDGNIITLEGNVIRYV